MKRSQHITIMIVFLLLLSSFMPIQAFCQDENLPHYTPEQLELLEREKIIDDIQVQKVLEDVRQFQIQQKERSSNNKPQGLIPDVNPLGHCGYIIISLALNFGSVRLAGHAAIVSQDRWQTIESYAKDWSPIKKDGVQKYPNKWGLVSGSLLYRPVKANNSQFNTAANYAQKQIGKPYNWAFWEKKATDAFYCSQLVWMSWLEAGVDVEAGSIPNAVVSPADIANSTNTVLIKAIP